MCGRYIIRMQEKYLREWHVHGPPTWLVDSYNVAPTQQVPIVRMRDGEREAAMARWGLVPFFTRGEVPKYSTINARIETFETAASYRGPWRRGQRCVQLASGFYEWHVDEYGRKAPYLITVADQELFGFAALWDRSVKEDGTAAESCVHITMPANERYVGKSRAERIKTHEYLGAMDVGTHRIRANADSEISNSPLLRTRCRRYPERHQSRLQLIPRCCQHGPTGNHTAALAVGRQSSP